MLAVVRHVARLLGLQVTRQALAIPAIEDRLHQGAADSAALQRRVNAEDH
ncbi:MAG: hypothetical protein ACREYE_03675 [Gammaproteobacteria bacterium]